MSTSSPRPRPLRGLGALDKLHRRLPVGVGTRRRAVVRDHRQAVARRFRDPNRPRDPRPEEQRPEVPLQLRADIGGEIRPAVTNAIVVTGDRQQGLAARRPPRSSRGSAAYPRVRGIGLDEDDAVGRGKRIHRQRGRARAGSRGKQIGSGLRPSKSTRPRKRSPLLRCVSSAAAPARSVRAGMNSRFANLVLDARSSACAPSSRS